MPIAIIRRAGVVEHEIALADRDLRVGRSTDNDIRLSDPNRSVSRFQGELRFERGGWWFLDLESQNGSWLRGERVQRVDLKPGLEVAFGDYTLEVIGDPAPRPEHPAGPSTIRPVERQDPTIVHRRPSPAHPSGRTEARHQRDNGRQSAGLVARIVALPKGILVGGVLTIALLSGLLAAAMRPSPHEAKAAATVKVSPPQPPPTEVPAASVEPTTTPAPVVRTDLPAAATQPDTPKVGTGGKPARRVAPASRRPSPAAEDAAGPTVVDGVSRNEGESAAAFQGRTEALRRRYAELADAVSTRQFTMALRLGDALLADEPTYRDVQALVERAREGLSSQAAQAMQEGRLAEGREAWREAILAYERAHQANDRLAGVNDDIARMRLRMSTAGDDAYRRARQYDSLHRVPEAIEWYKKAIDWLSPTDARRQTAEERLAVLTRP